LHHHPESPPPYPQADDAQPEQGHPYDDQAQGEQSRQPQVEPEVS
ncbi:hypothetical protein A2U01_0110623, partial [Trifolium medium]|nr:hypothetical protein [Trifolium medium]